LLPCQFVADGVPPSISLLFQTKRNKNTFPRFKKATSLFFGIEVVGRRRSRPTSWKKNVCQVERERDVLFLSLPNGLGGRWQQPDVGGLALVPVATLSDLCASSNVLNTFWSLHSLTLCGRANLPQQ
jgi:hypothetical protein